MSPTVRFTRQPANQPRKRKIARPHVLCVRELEDRIVPTLLGDQVFPADNPWNQRIDHAPVANNPRPS